jgi:EAL domain-containing protein (putative c-di-GMP-specific phosphodiesterase class I)
LRQVGIGLELAALGLLGIVVWRCRQRIRNLHRLLDQRDARLGELAAAVYAPDLPPQLNAIVDRTNALIAARTLRVALQPIIDLNNGAWVGAEALARFPDDRPPPHWFADAAEAGVSADLELHALTTAVAAATELPGHVRLSLNASPQAILDPRFPSALADSGLPLHRLTLEITEHAAVAHYPDIRDALAPLRARGLALAVDDAGAGYSSFAHVLQLRPDVIKLDRCLTSGVDHDPAARAFISGVVLLALELGAAVTAEGVETKGELIVLEALGVDHAQGHLLAPPTTERQDWGTWEDKTWSNVTAASPYRLTELDRTFSGLRLTEPARN